MAERLSNETMQRLCERLCQAAEGNLKGIKHQCYDSLKKNKLLFDKKKAICRRVLDVNFRLQSAGWNKLMDLVKEHLQKTRDKVRFIIKALRNQEAAFLYAAYKGLQERKKLLEGVGLGKSQQDKVKLLKRLLDRSYDLQCQAWNSLTQWQRSEDARLEKEKEKAEREQKEKDRILRRIMDSNLRMMGTGFRQSFQWMEAKREEEKILFMRQRGIMMRIIDSNARLMGMGFNKLLEEWKSRQSSLKEK